MSARARLHLAMLIFMLVLTPAVLLLVDPGNRSQAAVVWVLGALATLGLSWVLKADKHLSS